MKISKTIVIWCIVILGIILAAGWYVNVRNGFVTLDENLAQQWSQVEVQCQRRLDLIPNLVETVKGYAAHESTTFEKVTEARAGLSHAYDAAAAAQQSSAQATASEQSLASFAQAQQNLGKALGIYVNAVREAYPDLKADKQFLDLQTQLEGTENRIATERGRYTQAVRDYNIALRRFPGSIVASLGGFQVKPQYQADPEAATAPKVSF